jgi:hypothetical protein
MATKPSQRLSDAERDAVVVQLREGLSEGRLDLDDFRARLDAAYAAKTHGEIVPLTKDLPAVRAKRGGSVARRRKFTRRLRLYVGLNVIVWGVWTAQLATGGSSNDLWPLWVTIIGAAWLIWTVV